MEKKHFLYLIPSLILLSALISFLTILFEQAPAYTIFDHSFQWEIRDFILYFISSFVFLAVVLFLYSKTLSIIYKTQFSSVLLYDVLSFTPLIFLLLLPLVLQRYFYVEDFLLRLKIFSYSILFAVIYLKISLIFVLEKENSSFFKKLAKKISALSTKKKIIILFVIALIIYNTGSVIMISSGVSFSGDEPHYLLIAHSILNDGNFNLKNNYANRDYTNYMSPEAKIRPHIAPGSEGKYSFHSPGTSFVILPFLVLGSLLKTNMLFFIVRFSMSIIGALLGIQIFLYALQEWKNEQLALGLWLLFSFTSPVFFYSIHIYPELIITLLSFLIFRLLRFSKSFSRSSLILIGILLSSFIWFHALKYIFIMIPLFIYSMWILIKKHKIKWNILYFLSSQIFLYIIYFSFQYKLYGSLSLTSISWRGLISTKESIEYLKFLFTEIPFRFRWESLADYFLDQRDGLLLYAPIYFLSFLGIVEMFKRKRKQLLLLLFITAPYVLNSAFLTQRTGYAPQARPLVSVCWVLAIFLGAFVVYNAKKIFSVLFAVFSFISLFNVFILLNNPLALYQPTTFGETQRAGRLFLKLSNLNFYLPKFLPSFLKTEDPHWPANFIWIAAIAIFIIAYILVKKHNFSVRYPFHLIFAGIGVLIIFIWLVLYPRTVLLYPTKTTFPSGEKVTFYSLGNVARMEKPGVSLLPQDNRSYVYYFTSWRKIKNFKIDFISPKGDYFIKVKYFDYLLYKGKTAEEQKSFIVNSPPSYPFKNTNLYKISIYLERISSVSISENPCLFSIQPFR